MLPEIRAALDELIAGRDVAAETLQAAIGAIMDGRASEIESAALLTGLSVKGESAEEVAGAAQAMRNRCARLPVGRGGLLDTCGTGGDRLHTFNISTAAAIVVAAAGVPVAKHGNRGVSSASGSADVLQELGVYVELPPEAAAQCIDEIGIGFCFARVMHTAMKHVAPVRGALGFRTIFNLLGPLTNPAGAEYQLIGANRNATAEKLALAVARLGTRRTIVVCGADQLDEVSLWGETAVFDVREGIVERDVWTAATFGLTECRVEDLRVDSPMASAAVIRNLLGGDAGPPRDIVIANAAAALYVAGACDDLRSGGARAAEAIDSGAGLRTLERLVEWTQRRAKA